MILRFFDNVIKITSIVHTRKVLTFVYPNSLFRAEKPNIVGQTLLALLHQVERKLGLLFVIKFTNKCVAGFC